MKVFKLFGAAVAAALMLTSCLGDGDNSFSNHGFGVGGVSTKGYKPVLFTNFGALYAPNVSILPDVCYYTPSFEVDLNTPENENAAANGYYTAVISGLTVVTKGKVDFYSPVDTANLMNREIIIKDMVSGSYVEKYIFLGMSFDAKKNQTNDYQLFWNQKDSISKEDGVSVYSLFMRAKKQNDGTGETTTASSEFQAFKIGDVLESIMKKEGREGADRFKLKINYLSSVNEKDSTDLTWKSIKIECPTIKEENKK